ncbi:Retrovirus-related Pol polyprotein from type-1 retrotransposable element R1 2 [Eumeta japonica]|uniref:Retrovirus-related Pol polyprotein from type-1 retrotransposable element R1 2 n=1 Tax=Eumeta variegata TaxID=151549 RepID=A0A4C1Y9Y4_EUMVA|nr:Retrovirus-related Pol polyprotein from type-1 retrotransposable element R1 2 [Eumeta japonica]
MDILQQDAKVINTGPEGDLEICDLEDTTTRDDLLAALQKVAGNDCYIAVEAIKIRKVFRDIQTVLVMLAAAIAQKMYTGGAASYFTDRVLKYDTKNGPKEYGITGGIPQGSVLGPFLWNIMYEGLLRLTLLRSVNFVACADDVAVVIGVKHLDEISNMYDINFERTHRWMDTMNLQLAKHKIEAVLITSRKAIETIKLKVGE